MWFILFILFSSVYSDVTCSNNCKYDTIHGFCSPTVSSGNTKCSPEFTQGCPPSCKKHASYIGVCLQDDRIKTPNISFLYPTTTWRDIYTNREFTSDKKSKCRISTECRDNCTPKKEGDICELKVNFACPFGCSYNTTSEKCEGSSLCSPDYQNRDCPNQCDYDPQINNCIPRSSHFVCQKTRVEKCEGYFMPNPSGTTCEGKMCSECPFCPEKCEFDRNIGRCISQGDYGICETLVKSICPQYFTLGNFPNCDRFSRANICREFDGSYIYPLSKKDIYGDLKCVYPYRMDCDIVGSKISSCPSGCDINLSRNRCESSNNQLCGIVDAKNPPCNDKYMLLNITDGVRVTSKCLPKWYYER